MSNGFSMGTCAGQYRFVKKEHTASDICLGLNTYFMENIENIKNCRHPTSNYPVTCHISQFDIISRLNRDLKCFETRLHGWPILKCQELKVFLGHSYNQYIFPSHFV